MTTMVHDMHAPAPRVTFLGIGVQKCATSWLHGIMSAHPEIGSAAEKESDFFTAHFDRGIGWYEGRFSEGRAVGEFSPNYFTSRDAIERAHAYNPDLRLIAILRDPVARAFSNHLHEVRKAHIPADMSFEAAVKRNAAYIEQGRYGTYLRRWIDAFGSDQLLVLLAEDIASDPEPAYRAVCAHLGVSAEIVPEGLNERRHESVTAKNASVQKTLRKGGDALRQVGLGKAVKSMKEAWLIGDLVKMNRVDLRSTVTEMTPETRAYLGEVFAEDVAWVSAYLGRDLPWQTRPAAVSEGTPHVA